MKEKKYIITEEQRDRILQYLMTRPFAEVELGVYWLRNLPELHEEDDDKDS